MRGPCTLPTLLLAGLMSVPATASAADWLCHLSNDLVRLVCVAEPPGPDAALPDVRAAAGNAAAAANTTAVVHGTRFPLDPARLWYVDLWSPPNERADVERLARATICYRSPGCTVTVLPWGR